MANQKLGLNMNGGAGGKYMNGDDLDNLGNSIKNKQKIIYLNKIALLMRF